MREHKFPLEKIRRKRYIEGSLCHPLEVTLSSTIVIHVLRPYANEEEYLASERFSIDSKSMLLIDQPPLPADTQIVFDVQLENGQKPIRAEAKVIAHVTATPDKPGGLRVRFKRFGAATKSFIDRAIAQPGGSAMPRRCTHAVARPASGAAEAAAERAPSAFQPQRCPRRSPSVESRAAFIEGRSCRPAPVNREELLERLRIRARSVQRPARRARMSRRAERLHLGAQAQRAQAHFQTLHGQR